MTRELAIGWKVWMFFVFFLLVIILAFGSGYLSKTYQLKENEGIEFNCYQFDGRKNCNATIQLPNNITHSSSLLSLFVFHIQLQSILNVLCFANKYTAGSRYILLLLVSHILIRSLYSCNI